MANRTVKDAHCVRGTNPQYLIEKIIRSRIYDCRYWKEECFALSAELLVDKAMELKFVGGVFGGNIKPTPFLCLVLKMLQIQPEKDIVIEFIRQEDYKYVRALGATYMRIVGTSLDCYKYLEPLYNDYRKIRRQNRQGVFEVVHVDEYIDELLHEERVCDIILPRIQKRQVLEENNELDPRISALEDDLEGPESEEEEDDKDFVEEKTYDDFQRRDDRNHNADYREDRNYEQDFRNYDDRSRHAASSPPRRSRRSRSPHRREHSPRRHSRERERDRHRRRRSRSREDRDKGRERDHKHRSRSRSPDKRHDKKSSHHSKHSHKSRDHKDKDRSRRA